jgi:hypothetical protein
MEGTWEKKDSPRGSIVNHGEVGLGDSHYSEDNDVCSPNSEPGMTENIFDAIQHSLPVPWAVCATDGLISKCNPAFITFFSPALDPIGTSVFGLVDDEDAPLAAS